METWGAPEKTAVGFLFLIVVAAIAIYSGIQLQKGELGEVCIFSIVAAVLIVIGSQLLAGDR